MLNTTGKKKMFITKIKDKKGNRTLNDNNQFPFQTFKK